jgi:hypothetical protein
VGGFLMKSLSLCQKLGTFFLVLAVCVLAVGCGSNPVDAIIKEEKALMEEQKSGKVDAEAFKTRMEALKKKKDNLTDAQKKEYLERMLKEAFTK